MRPKLLIVSTILVQHLAHFTVSAQPFYKNYKKGKSAAERGECQEAVRKLQTAIRWDDEPSAKKRTYGVYREPYFPFFYLGRAYWNCDDFEKAQEYFERSISHGKLPPELKEEAESFLHKLHFEAATVRINLIGTGFLIEEQGNRILILTARHNLDVYDAAGSRRVPEVTFFNGAVSDARLLQEDDDLDLALLKVEDGVKEDALLRLSVGGDLVLEPDHEVIVVGYHELVGRVVRKTLRVLRMPLSESGARAAISLVLDEPLRAGYSGSPVIRNRRVVGMFRAGRDESYAIPAEKIVSFLKRSGIKPARQE